MQKQENSFKLVWHKHELIPHPERRSEPGIVQSSLVSVALPGIRLCLFIFVGLDKDKEKGKCVCVGKVGGYISFAQCFPPLRSLSHSMQWHQPSFARRQEGVEGGMVGETFCVIEPGWHLCRGGQNCLPRAGGRRRRLVGWSVGCLAARRRCTGRAWSFVDSAGGARGDSP